MALRFPFVSRKKYEALEECYESLNNLNEAACEELRREILKRVSYQTALEQKDLQIAQTIAQLKQPRDERGRFVRKV